MEARSLGSGAECHENVVMVWGEECLALFVEHPVSRSALVGLALNCDGSRGCLIGSENVYATGVTKRDRCNVAAPGKFRSYKIFASDPCKHRGDSCRAWISFAIRFLWHRFEGGGRTCLP